MLGNFNDDEPDSVVRTIYRPVFEVKLTEAHKERIQRETVWIDAAQLASDAGFYRLLDDYIEAEYRDNELMSEQDPVHKLNMKCMLRAMLAVIGDETSSSKDSAIKHNNSQENVNQPQQSDQPVGSGSVKRSASQDNANPLTYESGAPVKKEEDALDLESVEESKTKTVKT